MASRQCILAMKLEDIEREKFDRSLAKRQIRQYFLLSINCATRYTYIHIEDDLDLESLFTHHEDEEVMPFFGTFINNPILTKARRSSSLPLIK